MGTKHVRLKRYDPKHGIVLKQFWYHGIKFLESEGWYVVSDEVADYLKAHARQKATDHQSPEAFEICTEKEAREIDEKENIEATPRRPADRAKVTNPRGMTVKGTKKGRPKKTKKKSKGESPPESPVEEKSNPPPEEPEAK